MSASRISLIVVIATIFFTCRYLVAATCTPYLPDGGLFNNQVNFNRVPTTPAQVRVYSISLNSQNQVIVIQGNTTSVNTQVAVPSGMLAFYYFFGANNRFLVLDLETDRSTNPVFINYQQVAVDLTAWSPGRAQTGNFLSPVSKPRSAQLHIYTSPGYTSSSAGNGLAFFVWYGLGNNQVADAGIYRSDNGSQLCFVPSFTTSVQVIANVTPTTVQILDGNTPVPNGTCPLPTGSLSILPASLNFGNVTINMTKTMTTTLTNSGNDCLVVTNITSSSPQFEVQGSTNFSLTHLPQLCE